MVLTDKLKIELRQLAQNVFCHLCCMYTCTVITFRIFSITNVYSLLRICTVLVLPEGH